MQILVVFAAFIALCAASAIPIVPGDNSDYVEGVSRYIWMPDGEGVPHLVDLQASVTEDVTKYRNGANNQYWLFTRSNPLTPQVIGHGNVNSILSSNYNPNRPTMVLVHGWGDRGEGYNNARITTTILNVQDANVIVVDWSGVASSWYVVAARGVPSVGEFCGNFLSWLINTAGGNWNNVHLIGFSLGAHVVGNAGRTAGGLPARVTGLDPAGPLWWGSVNAIRETDGQYVEGIHTDGRLLGIFSPVGHADFYPNGGTHPQPGCVLSNCSHGRAPLLMAASIQFNHLIGQQCSDVNEANNVNCFGASLHMGNSNLLKRGTGIYALTTASSWPF